MAAVSSTANPPDRPSDPDTLNETPLSKSHNGYCRFRMATRSVALTNARTEDVLAVLMRCASRKQDYKAA